MAHHLITPVLTNYGALGKRVGEEFWKKGLRQEKIWEAASKTPQVVV